MPTNEELEKIAKKEQGLEKPKGTPVMPKRPPRKIGNLDKANQQIADLKKQLKSERARANSHQRYRDKEKKEHMESLRELNEAQKDRDDAKDRVKELERVPEKRKVSVITIGAQSHYRDKREHARNLAKKLIDDGVWYFSVGEEER